MRMDRSAFHLRHPRRAGHSLCGLRLVAEGPRPTVAVLAAFDTIQVMCSEGELPACTGCLFLLLRAALARFEVVLFDGRTGPAAVADPAQPFAGAAVRRRREAAGLTRAEVARLSGLSETTIRTFESGRRRPSARVLWHLMSLRSLCPDSET